MHEFPRIIDKPFAKGGNPRARQIFQRMRVGDRFGRRLGLTGQGPGPVQIVSTFMNSSPVIVNGVVYVGSPDGRLLAFGRAH